MNNIIAIASGKGGVGKTWLSVTLSHLFARSARQALLFDGDIGLANVDVQLGLTPQYDLGTVFSGKKTLREVIFRCSDGGFDVMAGRSGSTGMAGLTMAQLKKVGNELHEIAEEYDHVIVDIGAGIEQNVQLLASFASQCLVVITDEPTSLTDAYAFIKLCSQRQNMPKIGIVVNMAASQKEGERAYQAISKACSSFLKSTPPLVGVIRRDNKVKESIRNQQSLITRAPGTLAATDAAALSVKLMKRSFL